MLSLRTTDNLTTIFRDDEHILKIYRLSEKATNALRESINACNQYDEDGVTWEPSFKFARDGRPDKVVLPPRNSKVRIEE